MRSVPEGEQPPALPERLESLRIGIGRRIAVGGGQDNEDRVAFLHLASEDLAGTRQKPARILYWWVVSEHLLHDVAQKPRGRDRLIAEAWPGGEGQEHVPDQPCRRFVGLREKTDSVGDDDVRSVATEGSRLPSQDGKKGVAARALQKRPEELE